MEFAHPKRPRQYAVEIAALPKSQREAAIAQAPESDQPIIRHYLGACPMCAGRAARREAAHVA